MTAILLFLRGVPVWVWLALGLLCAGLFYGHLRYNAGQADVQADWDAEKAAFAVQMAEAEAAVAAKSLEVRTAYDAGIAASAKMREKEISDAYSRGKSAAAGIKSGAVGVRTVWRDRECPASAEGAGTGSGEWAAGVSDDRAEAIGRVLTIGGTADATYSEAYRRLESAQKLLNACFDGVPVAAP
jgi:hypothetical protein